MTSVFIYMCVCGLLFIVHTLGQFLLVLASNQHVSEGKMLFLTTVVGRLWLEDANTITNEIVADN